MSSPLSSPPRPHTAIHRVAIVFAGGPAPAANAVISAAADSFMRNGIQVVGILNGYSNLMQFSADRPLRGGEGQDSASKDYITLTPRLMRRVRNSQGIIIGTARANPGKHISHPNHFDDAEKVKPLETVYQALCSIDVDALISIGGDDTLKTANKLKLYQDRLAGRGQAHSDRAFAEDDRQRLQRHRFHLRLFHCRRYSGRRNSQFAVRCRSHARLLSGRNDGPQRRLAGIRRRHRRRGQPGD